jgi:hypothetical protein
MTGSESACPRGRARPSWAATADEADSRSTIGEYAGADPATVWRVIRGCGGLESVIYRGGIFRYGRANSTMRSNAGAATVPP